MSRRKPEAAESAPTSTTTTTTTPAAHTVTEEELPRWQRPSTFASRKPQADAANEALSRRRVVSLGEVEYTQRNLKTGEIDVLPAKMYFDRDRPRDRWVEIAGAPGQYVLDSSDARETVTKLPPLKNGMPKGPSAFTDPSIAEPPPRPV